MAASSAVSRGLMSLELKQLLGIASPNDYDSDSSTLTSGTDWTMPSLLQLGEGRREADGGRRGRRGSSRAAGSSIWRDLILRGQQQDGTMGSRLLPNKGPVVGVGDSYVSSCPSSILADKLKLSSSSSLEVTSAGGDSERFAAPLYMRSPDPSEVPLSGFLF